MKRWREKGFELCFWALFACCMLIAPTASAQFLPGISEMTGFGGVTINGENAATAGMAVTLNFTPQMGFEGEIGVIFADDEEIMVSGNVVLNLGYGTSFIVPYLTGGAGLINNGGTEIALNMGAGFKVFVEPNIALRSDFRVFLTTEGGDVNDLERFYVGIDFLF